MNLPISKHGVLAHRGWLPAVLMLLACAGCSGINASKSISPLDFILPGLMQNYPSVPAGPIQTNTTSLLAQGMQAPH